MYSTVENYDTGGVKCEQMRAGSQSLWRLLPFSLWLSCEGKTQRQIHWLESVIKSHCPWEQDRNVQSPLSFVSRCCISRTHCILIQICICQTNIYFHKPWKPFYVSVLFVRYFAEQYYLWKCFVIVFHAHLKCQHLPPCFLVSSPFWSTFFGCSLGLWGCYRKTRKSKFNLKKAIKD